MPPTRTPPWPRWSHESHAKFRNSVRSIRRRHPWRCTRFHKASRAYYRVGPGGRPQFLRGVHRVVEKAFGSLTQLVSAGGGCEGNASRSRTATSRGSRVGRELCSRASKAHGATAPKKAREHIWTPAVATALKRWGIHLIDGEVLVSRGHIATGVDLLGVVRAPLPQKKTKIRGGIWRLICIELKTGYRSKDDVLWKRAPLGVTEAGVKKSILNYALTQAQLTHECAKHTFPEFKFAPPLVVRVNDDGVNRWRPGAKIQAQCAKLLEKK